MNACTPTRRWARPPSRPATCRRPASWPTLVREAHGRYGGVAEGKVADYIPALAKADPDWFGICVAGVDGQDFAIGRCGAAPSRSSRISKPFVFALVCQALGGGRARAAVGVNATGLPFNSVMAIELNADRTMNPMVNAGAIATTSLAPGATAEATLALHPATACRASPGATLALDEEVYASEAATNLRNQGIARLLQGYGRMYCDPVEATDIYTRQCALNVTARDLAVMGATLADGGVNPVTKRARARRRPLPARAGGDGDGRAVRALGRLAVRDRPARQERRGRRAS